MARSSGPKFTDSKIGSMYRQVIYKIKTEPHVVLIILIALALLALIVIAINAYA